MMNVLFAAMFFVSFASAAALGRMRELSAAILEGGRNAVELLLTNAGSMAFFSGLMRICEKSGAARGLSRLLYPVLRWIFPRVDRKSEAFGAISMNLAANLLGIGNAATPFGLRAMQALDRGEAQASEEQIALVVLNTASMQILPATLLTVRAQSGSKAPDEILGAVLCASCLTLLFAILITKLFARLWRGR